MSCRLGWLYRNVLKIEAKAITYLKQSFNLAQSLYPVPVNAVWYKVSHALLFAIASPTSSIASDSIAIIRAYVTSQENFPIIPRGFSGKSKALCTCLEGATDNTMV